MESSGWSCLTSDNTLLTYTYVSILIATNILTIEKEKHLKGTI